MGFRRAVSDTWAGDPRAFIVLLWVTEVCGRTVSLMEVDTGAIGRPPGGMVGMGMHGPAVCIPRAHGFTRTGTGHMHSMYIHALTGRAITSVGITGPAIKGDGVPTTRGITETLFGRSH
jgi:hypothetical protein